MTDLSPAAAYHLVVDPSERPVLETALRVLVDDMAHTPSVRRPARHVLDRLAASWDGQTGPASLALDEPELKVVHTALRLLSDDLGREEAGERQLVRSLLDKLPDDHAIRAIVI